MTVEELVERARILLQDTVEPYRYPDDDLLMSLNDGLLEARRMRPDLFIEIAWTIPEYSVVDTSPISIDSQYHTPLMHFVVGTVELREAEETNEARASSFIQSFHSKLIGGSS